MNELIDSLPWSSRQVFISILPMMRKGNPYGWLGLTREDLAKELHVPEMVIHKAFGIFRKVGLISKSRIGYFSPLVVRELTIRLRTSNDGRISGMPTMLEKITARQNKD